jgi:hypothetical protein
MDALLAHVLQHNSADAAPIHQVRLHYVPDLTY